MSYCVYGLRLKGETEARYIGQSSNSPQYRIACMRGDRASPAQAWLLQHGDAVEGFVIARCDSREEALATEKVVIAVCLRLNHRLLNRDGVPKHLRIEEAA